MTTERPNVKGLLVFSLAVVTRCQFNFQLSSDQDRTKCSEGRSRVHLGVSPLDPLVTEVTKGTGWENRSTVCITCGFNQSGQEFEGDIFSVVRLTYIKRGTTDMIALAEINGKIGKVSWSTASIVQRSINREDFSDETYLGFHFEAKDFMCSESGTFLCTATVFYAGNVDTEETAYSGECSKIVIGNTLPSGIQMEVYPNRTSLLYVNDTMLIICGGGVGHQGAKWIIESRKPSDKNSSWAVRHPYIEESIVRTRPRCQYSGAVKLLFKLKEDDDGLVFRCYISGYDDICSLSRKIVIARDEVTGQPLEKAKLTRASINPCSDRAWVVFGYTVGCVLSAVAVIELLWLLMIKVKYPLEGTVDFFNQEGPDTEKRKKVKEAWQLAAIRAIETKADRFRRVSQTLLHHHRPSTKHHRGSHREDQSAHPAGTTSLVVPQEHWQTPHETTTEQTPLTVPVWKLGPDSSESKEHQGHRKSGHGKSSKKSKRGHSPAGKKKSKKGKHETAHAHQKESKEEHERKKNTHGKEKRSEQSPTGKTNRKIGEEETAHAPEEKSESPQKEKPSSTQSQNEKHGSGDEKKTKAGSPAEKDAVSQASSREGSESKNPTSPAGRQDGARSDGEEQNGVTGAGDRHHSFASQNKSQFIGSIPRTSLVGIKIDCPSSDEEKDLRK